MSKKIITIIVLIIVMVNTMLLSYQKDNLKSNSKGKQTNQSDQTSTLMVKTVTSDSLNRKLLIQLIEKVQKIDNKLLKVNNITPLEESLNNQIGWLLVVLVVIMLLITTYLIWNIKFAYKNLVRHKRLDLEKGIEQLHSKMDFFSTEMISVSKIIKNISQKVKDNSNTLQAEQPQKENSSSAITEQTQEEFSDNQSFNNTKVEQIGVKLAGKRNNKTLIIRKNNSEYFYIKRNANIWELYVTDNILNQVPSQEIEGLISEFFRIIQKNVCTKYEFKSPAIVEWDDNNEEGYMMKKGEIRQI